MPQKSEPELSGTEGLSLHLEEDKEQMSMLFAALDRLFANGDEGGLPIPTASRKAVVKLVDKYDVAKPMRNIYLLYLNSKHSSDRETPTILWQTFLFAFAIKDMLLCCRVFAGFKDSTYAGPQRWTKGNALSMTPEAYWAIVYAYDRVEGAWNKVKNELDWTTFFAGH
jgi:hypothetical protein